LSLIQDDLQLDIKVQGKLLLAIAWGTTSLDTALGALKQVLDAAAKHQVSRILVETLAVEGVLTTMEYYRLALEAVAHADQGKMNPRIAIVGTPPTSDGFCVRVAQNRGLTTELFPTRQHALRWLEAWRESASR
jgi:crotonobetainyl-CoA:carnitine CoA-transferase CaiB-like acyl-CoA transferase